MKNWSWKEGLKFAFAEKLLSIEGDDYVYKMGFSEKLTSQIVKPLYYMIELISKNVRWPLVICFVTLAVALILSLIFYNIPVFAIFGKLFPLWLLRFLLFFYFELNLFAIGYRAFWRFNNKDLVTLWKNGQLIAVLPGDYEAV